MQTFSYSVNPIASPSKESIEKNWLYLSQEAALMDRENPYKTWDYLVMPPSFPGLNLKGTTQKSHTAPERTTLRIYYSPPSARKIYLSAVSTNNKESLKQPEMREKSTHHSLSNDIIKDEIYGHWRDTLPFQWQSLKEHRFDITRSDSSSGFKSPGISSCLPLSEWDDSSNLSDDMKEMTASVLERRGKVSINQVVEVVSKGAQTQTIRNQHQPSEINSFVFPHPSISVSLEKMSGALEKLRTTPKLRQRHSSSSSFYSGSSSSNLSNSSSSLTSSLSSTSSLSTSTRRVETLKEQRVRGIPQSASSSSGRARCATLPGSTLEKTTYKTEETQKYGLVKVFFNNVCGRGEKPNPTGNKVPVGRRDYSGLKKADKPVSPTSRMPLVRNDNVTKVVNRKFIKHSRKDGPGPGQTETQGQCRNQAKTPKNKDTNFGTIPLEVRKQK